MTGEFLQKLVGEYDVMGTTARLYLKGESTLVAYIPGQPEFELVPSGGTRFLVKNMSGYSVEFKMDAAGNVTEAVVTEPYGGFTARKR